LSLSIITKIKEIVKNKGEKTYAQIAKELSMSYTTIYDMVNGRTWKHLK